MSRVPSSFLSAFNFRLSGGPRGAVVPQLLCSAASAARAQGSGKRRQVPSAQPLGFASAPRGLPDGRDSGGSPKCPDELPQRARRPRPRTGAGLQDGSGSRKAQKRARGRNPKITSDSDPAPSPPLAIWCFSDAGASCSPLLRLIFLV